MSKAKDKLVKPRLSSTIYVVFECRGCVDIYPEQVIAKGEDLFFHTGILDTSLVDEYKVPLYYKDYKEKWFKSLKEVREHFGKLKKKGYEGKYYWEVKND